MGSGMTCHSSTGRFFILFYLVDNDTLETAWTCHYPHAPKPPSWFARACQMGRALLGLVAMRWREGGHAGKQGRLDLVVIM